MSNSNNPSSERLRRLSKEGLWIVIGQVVAVLGSLVGVRLLTGLLDPAAYGELALGMTVATLLNQTVLGPLGNGVTRFYAPAHEKGEIGSYLDAVRKVVLSATKVIGVTILLTVAGLLVVGQKRWIPIAIAALVFAILSGYNSILNGIQNAARQRSIVSFHQGLESWVRFFLTAAMIVWFGATSTIAMIGYCIAAIAILVSQLACFLRTVPVSGNGQQGAALWQKQIWNYSWPFASWGMFTWAQQVSDRWALEYFSSTHEVGLYAVLFQLGYYPVSMATGMAVQFLGPIFYQRTGDASDNTRNNDVSILSWRLTWVSLGISGIASIATMLFHAQLFTLFVSKSYTSISYLLPWLLFSGGVFAASQTLALNLMSQMKTKKMAFAKITTALGGIALNFAGAYLYGIKGIVMASVVFSCSHFLWMAVLSKRIAVEAAKKVGLNYEF